MSNGRAAIRDLDVMEDIVAKRNDLGWDGWDVIHYSNKPASFMKANAVFRNGGWHVATRYPVTEDGWNVPGWLCDVAG